MMRTVRVGYACADAQRAENGSAIALTPPVRNRNLLRQMGMTLSRHILLRRTSKQILDLVRNDITLGDSEIVRNSSYNSILTLSGEQSDTPISSTSP